MPELSTLGIGELLKRHALLEGELRDRGVLRTSNGPTGDFAEYLFCRAFGWQLATNSKAGYDAVDIAGTRYQIKGRRDSPRNRSRQLSAIRNLEAGDFDHLGAVLFGEYYEVKRAVLLPRAVVGARARYNAHTNSHIFMLVDAVWELPEARDVTLELLRVAP